MDSPIVEKRIAGRTFFVTPHAIYEGIHPDVLFRQPGIEYHLILAPSSGYRDPPFGAWRREKWATAEGDHGVVFRHLETTLLDEEQVAWVLRNLVAGI